MNKYEVLILDGRFFIPNENSTTSYDLINTIMVKTKTCCRQSPGLYEFDKSVEYYRSTELKHYKIDSKKVIDVLKENGYNECESNNTVLPVAEIVLKNT